MNANDVTKRSLGALEMAAHKTVYFLTERKRCCFAVACFICVAYGVGVWGSSQDAYPSFSSPPIVLAGATEAEVGEMSYLRLHSKPVPEQRPQPCAAH